MRLLLQRVTRGSVQVSGKVTGAIDAGLVMLVGISGDDREEIVDKMAKKVANLRIFTNAEGKFDQSLLDIKGGALVVSQFTLYADTRKGRRPSFTAAARPHIAEPLVQRFAHRLQKEGVGKVAHGVFGAHMEVSLCNSGPVTIWIDSNQP